MTRPLPDVAGVSHRFVDARGVRFHVAEAGPADGEPVVLLHGWPQHWYEWRHLIGPLAERYRVICPDLRGFGWSEAPDRRYDMETLRRDMAALLNALGVERFHLVGHDWGGWIGFLLCLHHPDRVRRYLALNIPHPWQRMDLARTVALWRLAYQWIIGSPGLGPRVVRRLPELVARNPERFGIQAWTPDERESFLGQFREPERARASQRLYRSAALIDIPRSVAGAYRPLRLRTPTLLLFGTDDMVLRRQHVMGFEPYADDMRVELVPGIGHFIADEAPDLVAERALEHFGALSPAPLAAESR